MNIYENIRNNFENIINHNLKISKLLGKENMRTHYKDILSNKSSLKFYRYYKEGYHSIRNIEKSILPFKKYSEFNDPFEGISICSDNADKYYMDIIRDNAMISCLSESKNNILMFAHYSNSFKGFCVEYDLNLLSKEMNYILKYLFPVIYSEQPCNINNKYILSNGVKHTLNAYKENKISLYKLDDIISYFVHKANLWEYEREWRFIVPVSMYKLVFNINNYNNQNVLLLNNFDCISAIYLGLNINFEFKEHIKEIIEKHNKKRPDVSRIKVYETRLNDYEFKLDEFEI